MTQTTKIEVDNHNKEILYWSKYPSGWGYHWLDRGNGPEMIYIAPDAQYENDKKSILFWLCPGETRIRLDAEKMPGGWRYISVSRPEKYIKALNYE